MSESFQIMELLKITLDPFDMCIPFTREKSTSPKNLNHLGFFLGGPLPLIVTLLNSGSEYSSMYIEPPLKYVILLAISTLLKIGDELGARELLVSLVDDPTSPPGVRSRATEILGTLHSNAG